MDIIMSLRKEWCDKILNGRKPFEFRNRIGKEFREGSRIFLYETKSKGSGKVVGEATIEKIWTLQDEGRIPIFGAWNFIDWYFENIKKDMALADRFRDVKTNPAYDMPDYKYGTILSYALSDEELEHIREKHEPIDMLNAYVSKGDAYVNSVCKGNENSKKAINECDNWLCSIGFYNVDGNESTWKYAIQLKDIVRYEDPKEISSFNSTKNEPIERAPQSWCYASKS